MTYSGAVLTVISRVAMSSRMVCSSADQSAELRYSSYGRGADTLGAFSEAIVMNGAELVGDGAGQVGGRVPVRYRFQRAPHPVGFTGGVSAKDRLAERRRGDCRGIREPFRLEAKAWRHDSTPKDHEELTLRDRVVRAAEPGHGESRRPDLDDAPLRRLPDDDLLRRQLEGADDRLDNVSAQAREL